jgi:hypothetical protein
MVQFGITMGHLGNENDVYDRRESKKGYMMVNRSYPGLWTSASRSLFLVLCTGVIANCCRTISVLQYRDAPPSTRTTEGAGSLLFRSELLRPLSNAGILDL